MAQPKISRWGAHIVAALGGTAVGQVLAGVAQVLIVRALGVAGYGQYALLYAWLAVASSLLGAGLDTWVLDYQSRHQKLLGTTFLRILTIKTIVWVGCVLIAYFWLPNVPRNVVAVGMVVILVDSLCATGYQMLRAQNRHPLVAVLQLIGPGLLLAGVLCGFASDVLQIILLQLTVAVTTGAVLWWVVRRSMGIATDIRSVLLPGALPFVISDICAQLYTQSTTLLMGSMMTSTAVGIYRGAWSFVGYSFIVPAVLFQTTLPHLNAQQNSHSRRTVLRRSATVLLIYAVLMGSFVVYGAPWLLPLLYGTNFTPSAALLPMFAYVPLFKAMSFFGVLILLMEGRIRRRIALQCVVVTIVWLTAPWLIQHGGIMGAVEAQILSEGVLGAGYLLIAAWSLHITEPAVWPPRRILVTNMHGSTNVGDAAIHRAQYTLLHSVFPTADITLSCAKPQEMQHSFPATRITRGLHGWVFADDGTIAPLHSRVRAIVVLCISAIVGRWGIIPRWGLNSAEQASVTALLQADVVYASGGGYLYDDASAHPWLRLLSWDCWLVADLLLARAWHRPIVLLPQSIGPLVNRPFQLLLRWLLRGVQMVYARDSATAAVLTTLGVRHRIAPDLAWGLQTQSADRTDAPHVPVLGVSALDWGAQYPSFTGQQSYETALVTTIKHYLSGGWRIQLFSQCRDAHPAWDDRLVTNRIAAQVQGAIEVMSDITDPVTLAHAYAQVDCLIATRMHAAILRLRNGGSCVVIGYLPKAAALMNDLGLAAWHIPIDSVNASLLCTAIDTRSQQKPLIRDALNHIDREQIIFRDAVRGGHITAE